MIEVKDVKGSIWKLIPSDVGPVQVYPNRDGSYSTICVAFKTPVHIDGKTIYSITLKGNEIDRFLKWREDTASFL